MQHLDLSQELDGRDCPHTTRDEYAVQGWVIALILAFFALLCAALMGLTVALTSWALHAHHATIVEALTTAWQLLQILGNGGRPL
jgi:hypothetical protein